MTIPHSLDRANVVLTGAGSGIGRAMALAFAARGAHVVASDLSAERADETASLVRSAGGAAHALTVDVADDAAFEQLREVALARLGGVDIVVNNVGVIAMGAMETVPLDAWERVLDLNVLSIARSNCTFLPLLINQGHGHIVNTGSASGLLTYGFDRLPYVASKHAVTGISEAMARYLAPKGVGVTLLCPSGVDTNIIEQITFYETGPVVPTAPDHRFCTAEEVATLAADAVEDGTYLVVTEPSIHAELVARAIDPEAYVRARIEEDHP